MIRAVVRYSPITKLFSFLPMLPSMPYTTANGADWQQMCSCYHWGHRVVLVLSFCPDLEIVKTKFTSLTPTVYLPTKKPKLGQLGDEHYKFLCIPRKKCHALIFRSNFYVEMW
jgi:hypothetical protein